MFHFLPVSTVVIGHAVISNNKVKMNMTPGLLQPIPGDMIGIGEWGGREREGESFIRNFPQRGVKGVARERTLHHHTYGSACLSSEFTVPVVAGSHCPVTAMERPRPMADNEDPIGMIQSVCG
jgi:hypothetical protein